MTKTNHSQCDWGEGHSEGFQAGVIAERERIIKILENHRISIKDISFENWIGLWHDAIAKVKEGKDD